MKSRFAIVGLAIISLLSGCARQPFGYPMPSAGPTVSGTTGTTGKNATGRTVGVASIADRRIDRQIDHAFVTNYFGQIQSTLSADIRTMPQFKGVTQLSGGNSSPSDLVLKTELTRLEWDVPGYNGIIATTFALSVLTGGVGGIIYGTTSTEVNAVAVARFELLEGSTGRPVFSQEFTGRHSERISKLSCDTYPTKARVAGLAFRETVEQFKRELQKNTLAER